MASQERVTTYIELPAPEIIDLVRKRAAIEPAIITNAGFFDFIDQNEFSRLSAQLIEQFGRPDEPFEIIYQQQGSQGQNKFTASVERKPLTDEQRALPPEIPAMGAPSMIHIHRIEKGQSLYGTSLPVNEDLSIDRTRNATVSRLIGDGKRSESFTFDIDTTNDVPSLQARSGANILRQAMTDLALAAELVLAEQEAADAVPPVH